MGFVIIQQRFLTLLLNISEVSRAGCWKNQKPVPLQLNFVLATSGSPPAPGLIAAPPLAVWRCYLASFGFVSFPGCYHRPSLPWAGEWVTAPQKQQQRPRVPSHFPRSFPQVLSSLPVKAPWQSVCCFVNDDLIWKQCVCVFMVLISMEIWEDSLKNQGCLILGPI